jgi:hypothetical protein
MSTDSLDDMVERVLLELLVDEGHLAVKDRTNPAAILDAYESWMVDVRINREDGVTQGGVRLTEQQEQQLQAILDIEGYTLPEIEQLIAEFKRKPHTAADFLKSWKPVAN